MEQRVFCDYIHVPCLVFHVHILLVSALEDAHASALARITIQIVLHHVPPEVVLTALERAELSSPKKICS